MISSLANFLTLMFYHGDFPARVSWIVMMYTLGAVAIARVAIEQDRAYSLGYAVILGIVAFIAMLRFLDSPIFVILILLTIGYLSDAIVRDCTLIDDSADSSDQGLLDSGKQYLKEQMDSVPQPGNTDASTITASNTDLLDSNPSKPTRSRKKNQPGRTVMYLALAALPLFGIGQLFLRDDPATWQRAQRLLAFYLFSALSLLVTTSFLGLRRYLRQRKAEMPNEVSIGWISTGLLLISGILVIAFAVPVPGRTLATLDINLNLESSDGLKPSQFGWGKEGTKKMMQRLPRSSTPKNQKTTHQTPPNPEPLKVKPKTGTVIPAPRSTIRRSTIRRSTIRKPTIRKPTIRKPTIRKPTIWKPTIWEFVY